MTQIEGKITYRWSCPYCETSRTSQGKNEALVRMRGEIAVREHAYGTDGEGHGPRYTVPTDFHPIDRHIERITEDPQSDKR